MQHVLTFRRDEAGDPRATALDPTYSLLARFLEGELQGSIALCDELLAALAELTGSDSHEEVGNALSLRVDLEQACLETEVGDATATLAMPSASLVDAVARWRAFLSPETAP